MYIASLLNFFKTYLIVFHAIYRENRIIVLCILFSYIVSIVLLMGSILFVYLIVKSMIGEYSSIDTNFLGFQLTVEPSLRYVILAISFYAISAFLLNYSEKIWYKKFEAHLVTIVERLKKLAIKSPEFELSNSTITSGALSVFLISRRILSLIFPLLMSIGALFIMLYINFYITMAIVGIVLIFVTVLVKLGRLAKRDSIFSQDEDEEEISANSESEGSNFNERINRSLEYYILKTNTNLFSNLLFVIIMLIVVVSIFNSNLDQEKLVDFGFYIVLLNILYKGIKSVSLVSVALSKKYPSVLSFSGQLSKIEPLP